jgi:hypothetical protein
MRINGNIVLNSDATGEIKHLYVEKLAVTPAAGSQAGRLIYNTADGLFYYNDGTDWRALATGGNAGAIQQQLDNLIASVGTAVNSNGTWNGAVAFTGDEILEDATSITDALSKLSAASSSADSLAELSDVGLSGLSANQFLQYSGTEWTNKTLVLADVTDVTATAAEVNVLDGITASTAELNFSVGVTSNIQDQLDAKQDQNASLSALAALAGNGIVVQTGADTFANRSIVQPTEGLTVTNADGVAGNVTLTLANDLAALEDLETTGFIVRNADDSAVTRTITGTVDRVTVANGDGVAGSPTIDLATVTQGTTGNLVKVTVDAYGRVTGNTAVVDTDITALIDSLYVSAAGDIVDGNLVFQNGATVTGLPAPVNPTDAANKNYVDSAVAGLSWKNAVAVIGVANQTISAPDADIDGYTLVDGDRVLLIGQTDDSENGIYVFDGDTSALSRSTDADVATELNGAAVFVQHGLVYADSGWTQTAALTTFAGQNWVQFTGAGTYSAGIGLNLTGNTFNVNLGAGIAQLPSDEVGVDLRAGSALILTTDGTTSSTDAASQLFLKLSATGALEQDSTDGLGIADGAVGNVKLENASFTIDVDGAGTTSIALGGNLDIYGNALQGVSTSVVDETITVTVANASSSQKGVASFVATDFTVTAGSVALAEGGVSNEKLENSSITINGDTGTFDAELGSTVLINGSGAINVVASNGLVEVGVDDASTSAKGVASFASTDFTVTSGAVSLVAKGISSLTDVETVGAEDGQTLVNEDGVWVNQRTFFVYTGSSSTSHVVNHNIGQKFCHVTVVDENDEVIIPESIKFNSVNQLTVLFTSAIACTIVVSGVAGVGV